jgi:hypothetical protein
MSCGLLPEEPAYHVGRAAESDAQRIPSIRFRTGYHAARDTMPASRRRRSPMPRYGQTSEVRPCAGTSSLPAPLRPWLTSPLHKQIGV